jgi:hypothetical protein
MSPASIKRGSRRVPLTRSGNGNGERTLSNHLEPDLSNLSQNGGNALFFGVNGRSGGTALSFYFQRRVLSNLSENACAAPNVSWNIV